MANDCFPAAYVLTMGHEGEDKLTNDKLDPGGMTFSGISRVNWPYWEGWALVDEWAKAPRGTPVPAALSPMVKQFYRVNFWGRIQGDALAALAPDLAFEVFDTAVNMDVSQAVRFLQAGYNVARGEYWSDLLIDGKLGPKALAAVRVYLASAPGTLRENLDILLNCMNGEQYVFYKANPRRRRFRGWFKRV